MTRHQLKDELACARSERASIPTRAAARPYLRASYLVLSLLVFSTVCGCGILNDWAHNCFKVGPEYGRPAAPVSEAWIDTYDEKISTELPPNPMWWETFNDPVLNQLVQSVYQQNLTLRAAGMRVLNARAQRGITIGGLFPQQQSNFGQFQREQFSVTTNGLGQLIGSGALPINREFGTWTYGFNMAWELDIWGKFRRAVEAADANLDASIEDYDAVLVSLLAETASTYVEYRTAEQRLDYALKNVEIQKGSLGIVEAKEDAGAVTFLDVTQARSTLKNTEQLVPVYRAQMRDANNRLCTLLGIPVRDLSEELGEAAIPTAPPEVAVGIPADLLRRRPDVRAAERRVAAQCALIGVAVADLLPHFSITGSVQFNSQRFKDLFSSASTAAAVAPGFNWDILNYGRLINSVRAEEAFFQELAYQYQQAVLNANQEAETAINVFLRAQQRLIYTREAVEASEQSLEIVTEQYNGGLADFNRVFNIQLLLVQDQDRYATTQGDVALALVAIYRSLGGGWEIRNGYMPVVTEMVDESLIDEQPVPDEPPPLDPDSVLIRRPEAVEVTELPMPPLN
jgi:NodT family efflux transporter outer membrane factor (OMF) lipoprotein